MSIWVSHSSVWVSAHHVGFWCYLKPQQVAVKVLGGSFAADENAVKRF